jgi:hypothetical protein
MASLTGQKIKDTYQSLLKTDDNGLITNAFKGVTDGSGSASGLYLKKDGVEVSGSLASQMFMNPQTITGSINIPAHYNAFLVGPVGFTGTVTVGTGSNLAIL